MYPMEDKMQRLVLCYAWEIDGKINSLLSKGYKVVPDTTVISSVEEVRDKYSSLSSTPSQTIFKVMISVVLETNNLKNDEVR